MSFVFRINDVFDRFNSSSLQMVDGAYRCHTGRFSFEAERLGQYEVEKVAMSYSILEASWFMLETREDVYIDNCYDDLLSGNFGHYDSSTGYGKFIGMCSILLQGKQISSKIMYA